VSVVTKVDIVVVVEFSVVLSIVVILVLVIVFWSQEITVTTISMAIIKLSIFLIIDDTSLTPD
jgi:hypothetical protein